MSANKRTIERYIDGFRRTDRPQILSCVTDDVEWEMPGTFHHHGKEAFDKEITNDAFTGDPEITITTLVEEHDVVVAEGYVRVQKKEGGFFEAVFCDVFVMNGGRIRKLTTYLLPRSPEIPPLASR